MERYTGIIDGEVRMLRGHTLGQVKMKLFAYENFGTPEQFRVLKEQLTEYQKYKRLEEQGLLLKLPYNIGNCGVIYYVDERDSEIYRLQADRIEISKTMISNKFAYTIDSYEFYFEDFGKIVFTSKEEAEKKLAEMEVE